MFGKTPTQMTARISNDVRAAVGYSNSLAIACGAERINTAHLLAAVASHPDGNTLLSGKATDVFTAVMGDVPRPAMQAADRRLESEDEFKKLIQSMTLEVIATPARKPSRLVELSDIVGTALKMPDCAAYEVLQRCGFVGPDEPTA
jgi:hypothetical protein